MRPIFVKNENNFGLLEIIKSSFASNGKNTLLLIPKTQVAIIFDNFTQNQNDITYLICEPDLDEKQVINCFALDIKA